MELQWCKEEEQGYNKKVAILLQVILRDTKIVWLVFLAKKLEQYFQNISKGF